MINLSSFYLLSPIFYPAANHVPLPSSSSGIIHFSSPPYLTGPLPYHTWVVTFAPWVASQLQLLNCPFATQEPGWSLKAYISLFYFLGQVLLASQDTQNKRQSPCYDWAYLLMLGHSPDWWHTDIEDALSSARDSLSISYHLLPLNTCLVKTSQYFI